MTSPTVHPFLLGLLQGSHPETLLSPAPTPNGWEPVVRDATVHGLAPLLYRWLKTQDPDGRLLTGLLDGLQAEVHGLAARNLMLAGELQGLLRVFGAKGLPCAPLRGLALAEDLYGDITARPTGDLDLLVRPADLHRAAAILRDLGFMEMEHRPGFARTFSYTLVFVKERHGWLVVEPHWTIAYPPFVERLDMDGVWRRCVRGRVLGVESWRLAPEDLLLHLCLHLAHQGAAAPLVWLYDVDRLLRQAEGRLDWSRVLSVARPAGLGPFIVPVLREARTLFATPFPDAVVGLLAGDSSGSAHGRLVHGLARRSRASSEEEMALFLTLNGFSARFSYALGLLFPSPAFMRIRYGLTGRRALGFAYVRRVCRVSWEGVKGIARLVW